MVRSSKATIDLQVLNLLDCLNERNLTKITDIKHYYVNDLFAICSIQLRIYKRTCNIHFPFK